MRHRFGTIAVVAMSFLAGCSGGSDSTSPDSSEAPTTEAVPTESDDAVDPVDGIEGEASTAAAELTVSASAPPGASIAVASDSITDDRIIRRGAQSEIRQGQVFVAEDPATVESISFEVVAPEAVEPGELVALNLYLVGDPATSVPSGIIDLGADDGALVLPVGVMIDADVPTHLTFSLPDVQLVAGQHYAAVLSLHDGATAATLYMQHATTDAYPDGVAVRFEGSTWKADRAVGDQAFAVMLG